MLLNSCSENLNPHNLFSKYLNSEVNILQMMGFLYIQREEAEKIIFDIQFIDCVFFSLTCPWFVVSYRYLENLKEEKVFGLSVYFFIFLGESCWCIFSAYFVCFIIWGVLSDIIWFNLWEELTEAISVSKEMFEPFGDLKKKKKNLLKKIKLSSLILNFWNFDHSSGLDFPCFCLFFTP